MSKISRARSPPWSPVSRSCRIMSCRHVRRKSGAEGVPKRVYIRRTLSCGSTESRKVAEAAWLPGPVARPRTILRRLGRQRIECAADDVERAPVEPVEVNRRARAGWSRPTAKSSRISGPPGRWDDHSRWKCKGGTIAGNPAVLIPEAGETIAESSSWGFCGKYHAQNPRCGWSHR